MVSLLDIIGPVMVGPSSSHTAGACRLGLLARGLVGGTPERAKIELHGSFARTGEGHGTDKAIVGSAYQESAIPRLPRTLAEATDRLADSKIARELFGEGFVDHFVRTRRWEWSQFADAVTSWELQRYFEII